jgi:hypothetical protein
MKKATLTIDGTDYSLVYDFNRICEAEAETNCNLLRALYNLLKLKAAELRGLLYAAIERDGKRLTLTEVGGLIRVDTVGAITNALGEAYTLALSKEH